MNKKASTFQNIGILLIGIVVLLILFRVFFSGPSSLFGKAENQTDSIFSKLLDYNPFQGYGADYTPENDLKASKNTLDFVNNFQNTVEWAKEINDQDCIFRMNLPNIEPNEEIEFYQSGNNIEVTFKRGDLILKDIKIIKNLKICTMKTGVSRELNKALFTYDKLYFKRIDDAFDLTYIYDNTDLPQKTYFFSKSLNWLPIYKYDENHICLPVFAGATQRVKDSSDYIINEIAFSLQMSTDQFLSDNSAYYKPECKRELNTFKTRVTFEKEKKVVADITIHTRNKITKEEEDTILANIKNILNYYIENNPDSITSDKKTTESTLKDYVHTELIKDRPPEKSIIDREYVKLEIKII